MQLFSRFFVRAMATVGVVISLSAGYVCAQADPNFHIYLALGQSNMQGAAHLPDNPISHPRVQVLQGQNCSEHNIAYGQWREHFQPVIRCREGERTKPDGSSGPIGLSPVDTFAVAMAEAAEPNVTIGLVGAAYGGTDIRAHLPNCADFALCQPPFGSVNGAPVVNGTTPIYQWILDLAKQAQQVGVIKGIIFHHGESNAGQDAWLGYVESYISQLRQDLNLNPSEVPFIAGELPRTGCCASAHNPIIRRLPNVLENSHWVSSGPMPDGTVLGDRSDRLHWSTFSVIEMGKRYANKMLEVSDDEDTPNASTLRVEMESLAEQSTAAPFEIASEASASGGSYLVWPNSGEQLLATPSNAASGQVAVDFNLTQNTDLSLGIRVDFANASDDSFYYKLDNQAWQTQNNNQTNGWTTLNLASYNNLAAGIHRLSILRREDGAKLDRLQLIAGSGAIALSTSGSSSSSSSNSSSSSSTSSSSSSTSSSSSGDISLCNGVNEYPNWPRRNWALGEYDHADTGDLMHYQGVLYEANWYTTTEPGSDASWSTIGNCN